MCVPITRARLEHSEGPIAESARENSRANDRDSTLPTIANIDSNLSIIYVLQLKRVGRQLECAVHSLCVAIPLPPQRPPRATIHARQTLCCQIHSCTFQISRLIWFRFRFGVERESVTIVTFANIKLTLSATVRDERQREDLDIGDGRD